MSWPKWRRICLPHKQSVRVSMPVRITIDGAHLEAPVGPSIFDCAERTGIRITTSCKKNGKCRECLVEVTGGMDLLSPPSAEEAHLRGAFRLSCRARIAAPAGEVSCRTFRRGGMRILEGGRLPGEAPPELDPAVVRRPDGIYRGGERIEGAAGPILGLAVDVGTTTVVLRLVDLETGAGLAAASFENPQRFGGTDIMARIRYDTENPGRILQRTLLAYLADAIRSLPADPGTIHEVVVAGNSTMRDLFFGLDVGPIGQRPYRSTTQLDLEAGLRGSTSLAAEARALRLPVHPAARIVGLPLVHGHVGADAAAAILAVGLPGEDRTVALMDIGTNTELAIGSRDRLLVASCPAGPAFEGGGVSCGMAGFEGAIEGVRIGEDGSVACRVIGGGPPRGICGSGLVELLGELLRTGRMDDFGRLSDGAGRFPVAPEEGISLSEADSSELAQAKGANVAGLRIVLDRAGIDLDDLGVFYLAGGFAEHLDLDAARRIGLLPDLPDGKIVKVGNAAIEGATIALLSVSRRRALETYVRRAEHVELETDPDFFDRFVDGCRFIPVRGGRR